MHVIIETVEGGRWWDWGVLEGGGEKISWLLTRNLVSKGTVVHTRGQRSKDGFTITS